MNSSLKRLLISSCVIAAVALLLILNAPTEPQHSAQATTLKAAGAKQWYRGNLHTHSLWSDGDDYLEMIALWYREHDYDFLGFTDHNILATSTDRWVDIAKKKTGQAALEKLKAAFPGDWVESREVEGRTEVRLKTFQEVSDKLAIPGRFLLIQGEEITDSFQRLSIHMNATNLKSLIPPLHGESVTETMQNNVNAVVAQRERTGQPMFIHLNHPNFGYGITAEDLAPVRGERFFEVYNGHPGVNNSGNAEHASTERLWDIVLTKRLAELGLPVMYGVGTDDGHNYHNIPSRASEPGRGWVMVLADELQPAALIAAMERGDFYASSGVTLESVTSSSDRIDIKVVENEGVDYRIEFIGTLAGYDAESSPILDKNGKEIRATRRYSDDIGKVLKTVDGRTASYEFRGSEIYVRARVTSTRKHPNPSEIDDFEQAWIQPVVGKAAK
ncbi:hypothetical protein GC176_14700 [bacterium]|nr:hypothetical protein [bacterium]